MKNLDKKILEKIKKEKIKPKPSWRFVAQRVLIYFAIALFFGFSVFALSALFANLFADEVHFAKTLAGGLLNYFLLTAGLVWIGFSVFFASFVFILYRKSKYGYRKSAWAVVLILFVLQAVFAFGIYKSEFSKKAQDFVKVFVPILSSEDARELMWHKPEKGLFVGVLLTEIDLPEDFANFLKKESGGGLQTQIQIPQEISFISLDGEIVKAKTSKLDQKSKVILALAQRLVFAGVWDEQKKILQVCALKPSPKTPAKTKAKIQKTLKALGLTPQQKNGVFKDLLEQIEESGKITKCR